VPEEVGKVLEEISEAKEALRRISEHLRQIERHVQRAFPPAARSAADMAKDVTRKRQPSRERQTPSMTSPDASALFDTLSDLLRSGSGRLVEKRLLELREPDLKLLAREIGIPSSRASKREIAYSVIRRINERLMLSQNRNVTAPRSQQQLPGGKDASDDREKEEVPGPGRSPS
jgi:hypothetical protein